MSESVDRLSWIARTVDDLSILQDRRILRSFYRNSRPRFLHLFEKLFLACADDMEEYLYGGGAKFANWNFAALTRVCAWVVTGPEDMVTLSSALEEPHCSHFLDFYAASDVADDRVLSGAIKNPRIFDRLPHGSLWIEAAIVRHGALLLNSGRMKPFSLKELAPLGLDYQRSAVRSVIGSAVDRGMLQGQQLQSLLQLFPEDRHFRRLLGEPKKMIT